MNTIKKISRWIFGLVFILSLGLFAGYGLSILNSDSKNPSETSLVSSDEAILTEDSKKFEPNLIEQIIPAPKSVDQELIEDVIFELVNKLRSKLEVIPVQKNDILKQAAEIRALEIEDSFSHTRPNGTEPFSVLSEEHTIYDYFMAGENLAMATYYRDDEYMARLIFNGWVESKDHYETMINPEFEEIGIGVHYDGDLLYATQFFGTQKK